MQSRPESAGYYRAAHGSHLRHVWVSIYRDSGVVGLGTQHRSCAETRELTDLQLSDRYGRMWVLGFNVTGLMLSDLSFLAVAHFWETLPGTYWWFALGPAFEGSVGG